METLKTDLVEELNKLAVINNDRTEGYQKASSETEDMELKTLFSRFALQSRKFNSQLQTEITKAGGKPETGTTESGKLYRVWMDIRAALTGKDKKQILSSCEYGEDVARDTYKDVLKDTNLPTDLLTLITSQFNEIDTAHSEIKKLRDTI